MGFFSVSIHNVTIITLSKFVSLRDVLWGWASYEYHDHLAITNSTVFAKYWYMYLELP